MPRLSAFVWFVCFVGSGIILFSSFPQALPSQFDEHVFERGTLQLDVGKFDALLVNPLHQLRPVSWQVGVIGPS